MDFDRGQKHSENNLGDLEKEDSFLIRILKFFSRDNVGVKIIFIIGILSVFLGFWRIIFGIKTSFVLSPIALKDKSAIVEGLNSLKDTDGDRLSDYDEINIYKTSPYLVDTNSNEISDYDEVILGRGNNCSDFLSCNASANLSVASASSSVFGEAIDYGEIKKQMLDAGYSQDIVDKLVPASEEFQNASTSDWERLKNLPAKDIRALLIQQGATEQELSQFSDEQIQALYVESLNQKASEE